MRIVVNPHLYFLEEIDEIESFEEMADFLGCFVNDDVVLLFNCLEANYLTKDENERKFINERIMFRNNEWVQPFQPSDAVQSQVWYRVVGRDEIVQALKIDQYYLCVILKRGAEFNNISYVLNIFESTEFEVLQIEDRTQKEFRTLVLPRLKDFLKERLDIIDLEQ